MSRLDGLIETFSLSIPNLKDFLTKEKRTQFEIVDHSKDGSFVIQEINTEKGTCTILHTKQGVLNIVYDQTKSFTVVNNSNNTCLIRIDGKLGLLKFDDSYCDFILFDENVFCFVEMKLNASSDSPNAIQRNRIKAIKQIASSAEYFDQKLDRNYEKLSLEAYVATPGFYPRQNTSWEDLRINFLETHGIPLFEGTHKVFN